MTTRNLNINSYDWQISALTIKSNQNVELNIDTSGNGNIYYSKNDISLCVIGTNVDVCSNTYTNTCSLSVGTYNNQVNTSIDCYGTYYSYNSSSMVIPSGSTSNRPSNAYAGSMRYNTTENYIEYYNSNISSWLPIAAQTPNYTSILPNYLPEDSSLNYTITGTNFNSSSTVSFIGNVDSLTYPAYSTIYLNSNTLTCRNTLAMSDASNNSGFYVKIINTNSNLSITSSSTQLFFDPGPAWVSPANNTNLGISYINSTYNTSTTPFTQLVATDDHTPLFYRIDPSGTSVGGMTLDGSTGKLIGTTSSIANNYSFNAVVLDSSGAIGPVRTFSFNITDVIFLTINGTLYNLNASPQSFSSYGYYTLVSNATCTVKCQLWGAGGGGAQGNSGPTRGAAGGYVEGRVQLLSGTTYVFLVGQGGAVTTFGPYGPANNYTGPNAFPDGGASLFQENYGQSCGGGSTRLGPYTQSGFNITNSSVNYNNTNAVYYLIAGAGAGAADYTTPGTANAAGTQLGYGAYPNGSGGGSYYTLGESLAACGGGGTQSAGGAAGSTPARLSYAVAGAKYSGGNGSGGGGGGGYYGGGGARGYYSQAGGGSSYYNPSFVTTFNSQNAITNSANYYTSPVTGISSNKPTNSGNGGAAASNPSGNNAASGYDGAIIFTFVSAP